jgi:predicted transcriptional regulator
MVKKLRAVRINARHLEKLKKLAKKEGETVSFFIQQAVREFLEKKHQRDRDADREGIHGQLAAADRRTRAFAAPARMRELTMWRNNPDPQSNFLREAPVHALQCVLWEL